MSRSDRSLHVRRVAQESLAPHGLVVEDVTIVPAGARRVVRVVVDRDLAGLDPADETSPVAPVSLDEVADASRGLGAALDEADVLGETAYVLEVTSPGVDRPLALPRHFRRNVGRLVDVRTGEGERVLGRLRSVGSDQVVLAAPDTPGSRRAGAEEGRSVRLSDIVSARVQVEFAGGPDEDLEES